MKKERNYGIELFRSFAMILIIVLHVLGQGGVLSYCKKCTEGYYVAWFLEVLGYCSVNCYALITGYVNDAKEFSWKKLFWLWLDVFLLLVGTLVVYKFAVPGTEITASDWSDALMPLTRKSLWYFNAYALSMPFIPLLNRGLSQLNRKQHLSILGILFLLTSCLHVINGADNFVLSSGYSAMWLIILYVFGAYFRMYGIPKPLTKWYVTLPVTLLASSMAWWLRMHRDWLVVAKKITSEDAAYDVLSRFVSYTSPFMVIMGICLLCFFAGIKIRTKVGKTVIATLGKTSFGVYAFHVGPFFWDNWMSWRFKDYAKYAPPKLALAVILTAIGLYLIFSLVSGIEKQTVWCFRYIFGELFSKKKDGDGKNEAVQQ